MRSSTVGHVQEPLFGRRRGAVHHGTPLRVRLQNVMIPIGSGDNTTVVVVAGALFQFS